MYVSLFLFISGSWQADVYMKAEMKYKSKNERELKLSKGKAVGLCLFVYRRRKYRMIIMKRTLKFKLEMAQLLPPESGPIHFKHLSLLKNKYTSEEYYFFLLSSQIIALDSRSCLLLKL